MDTASEARLALVMPVVSLKIHHMYDLLSLENLHFRVAQGQRTWLEQDDLYALSRTKLGKRVTDARGGYSWHNFGCAVDCYPLNVDGSIDWTPEHPQWKRMEAVGVNVGLVSGANWVRLVDAPHFQLTGRFPMNAPNDEARALYKQSPETFWKEVEASIAGA